MNIKQILCLRCTSDRVDVADVLEYCGNKSHSIRSSVSLELQPSHSNVPCSFKIQGWLTVDL